MNPSCGCDETQFYMSGPVKVIISIRRRAGVIRRCSTPLESHGRNVAIEALTLFLASTSIITSMIPPTVTAQMGPSTLFQISSAATMWRSSFPEMWATGSPSSARRVSNERSQSRRSIRIEKGREAVVGSSSNLPLSCFSEGE